MSIAHGAGRRIVVSVEAGYDTASVEALIVAARVEIEALLPGAQRSPSDLGMLAYARDTLRVANESLEMRRRLRADLAKRTGP